MIITIIFLSLPKHMHIQTIRIISKDFSEIQGVLTINKIKISMHDTRQIIKVNYSVVSLNFDLISIYF